MNSVWINEWSESSLVTYFHFAARPGIQKPGDSHSNVKSYLEPIPLTEKGLLPADYVMEDPDAHFIYMCKKNDERVELSDKSADLWLLIYYRNHCFFNSGSETKYAYWSMYCASSFYWIHTSEKTVCLGGGRREGKGGFCLSSFSSPFFYSIPCFLYNEYFFRLPKEEYFWQIP